MSFADLGLSTEVLQAVNDAGYETPTPIQEQAIPYILMGRDVLGCAQTGTGKTAGFTLPMIDILAAGRARARMPRSLILEPTRELAAQVSQAFEVYGKHHKLNMALLIGGESFTDQEKKLDRGVDVLIATPGRLIDLYERGKILMSDVKILVIDEADRMLDMGFIPDVERIVSLIPKIRQTLFFSATMPPEIKRLADAFLMNPKEISVAPPASPAETVAQHLLVVDPLDKRETLRQLLRTEDVKNAIVFCNRKRDVDILNRSLLKHGIDAAALHGDMPQSKRTETLERFKNGDIRILVASDVAARGLDVQGLSHVFNFDVPFHAEDYVHRIGRTGRAGRDGCAFTLAAPEDGKAVAAIEALIRKAIPHRVIDGIPSLELSTEETGNGRHRRTSNRGRPRQATASRAERAPEERPRQRHPEKSRPAKDRPANRTAERGAQDARPVRPEDGADAEMGATVTPIGLAARREGSSPHRDRDQPANEPKIVGFGDHLPAFLRRPARVAGA